MINWQRHRNTHAENKRYQRRKRKVEKEEVKPIVTFGSNRKRRKRKDFYKVFIKGKWRRPGNWYE